MTNTKKTSLITFVVLAFMQLTGCAKTVQWEEDVLLNTGETIVVSKEVRYTIKGQPGNPLDLGYLPDFIETTSFKYGGRDYIYKGDAAIIVLAISPQKFPVLLAPAGDSDWYRHKTAMSQTVLRPIVTNTTGQQWFWPDQIDSWTKNLPANLMRNRLHPSELKRRYNMEDKSKQTYIRDPLSLYLQKSTRYMQTKIAARSN